MTPLRVLQSFTPDRGDVSVNPYSKLLETSVAKHCEVHRFTWSRALLGKYDVFHSHWPEHLIGNKQWLRRTVSQLLFAAWLLVLGLRRIAVVQTVHNEVPHAGDSRISAFLLKILAGRVNVRVYLHKTNDIDPRTPARVFLHGDYRGWFGQVEQRTAEPGRLVFFGRVQPYKNVPGLVQAFNGVADPGLRLVVAGSVTDAELRRNIVELAQGDSRVELRLHPLDDHELADTVLSAEAVVLPYDYLYNSGVMILSLSLGRPVIVPGSAQAAAIADEVGSAWVTTFEQPLDAPGLATAVTRVRATGAERAAQPRFVGRDWNEQARRLVAVYGEAVALRRGGRS